MHIPPRVGERMYWLSQRLRRRCHLRERLDFLMQSQWWSPKEQSDFQMKKLHGLVEHAYNTVPYYRSCFDERGLVPGDIQSVQDLRKLPLLTRSLLLEQQHNLLSSEADHKTLQTNFSSGSTGQRAAFVQDADFRIWMRAHQLRTYQWCSDWRIGEPFALLWGSEIYWSFKQVVDRVENVFTNRREFNTFSLSPELIRSMFASLMKFKPTLVSTYANAMHLIAHHAEASGMRLPSLRCVQGTSEPLSPEMRQRIKKVFDCDLYDKYGMRETNIICHESPNHEQMCIQSENVFVEFLNDRDEPCRPGETGRVVVTQLNNRSMPLIRYATSDLAAPVEGYCSSGIGLPRMTAVSGRQQDLISTPDGRFVDAYLFSYLFMRYPHIQWFQVLQHELDQLVIKVLVPEGLSSELREKLVAQIHQHAGYPFGVTFKVLAAMPESATGKFRLCVNTLGKAPTTGTTATPG